MRCPMCGKQHRRKGHRYCLRCHAAYNREWRKTHPLTAEQRMKDTARSYANVYKQRGILVPEPCMCGATKVEMHHPNYKQPARVEWMCRPCHLKSHRKPTRPFIHRRTDAHVAL